MDRAKIETAVRMILEAIGEDPGREGLLDTPRRVADLYSEAFSGMGIDLRSEIQVFNVADHDEMILVKDIPFYSICEHHLLPFMGKAHVAYVPTRGKVTGLSKLARAVDVMARRPQVQERMTTEIADALMQCLMPQGVAVVIEAEHLCMTLRGAGKLGSKTVTSAVRGIFRRDERTRAEVLALIKG